MKLKVTIDRIVELVAVAFRPLDERKVPIAIEPSERTLEAHSTAKLVTWFMDLVPMRGSPVGVEAESAPAIVGIVCVRRELQEDLRITARLRGPHDKEHAIAQRLARTRTGFIASACPRRRNLYGECARPVAAVGTGILGNRVISNRNVALAPDHLAFDSKSCDLNIDLG